MALAITKEGSFILIGVGKENPVKFNCVSHEITSYTGRTVQHFPRLITQLIADDTESQFINLLKEVMRGYTYRFSKIEPFITVIDKLDWSWIPDECPKGFIKWCEEENKRISGSALAQFKAEKAMKDLPKEIIETYDFFKDKISCSERQFFMDLSAEKKALICKVFKTSMKSFSWSFRYDFQDFLDKLRGYENRNYEWEKYIDTNRGFAYNLGQIDSVIHKERNDKILAWEDKFRAIETLSNEEYVIIVPKTMQDFTNEGKQQNNCVGYYYHDSIAAHKNFVYFVRKANNPKHSFMTCRFNFEKYNMCTCEYRYVNNNSAKRIDLLNEIDKMIIQISREE